METELPTCRICIELERHVQSAQQPVVPALLVGLTEAGNRNRVRQREEKLLKAELELEKHRKSAHSG